MAKWLNISNAILTLWSLVDYKFKIHVRCIINKQHLKSADHLMILIQAEALMLVIT